MGPPQQRPAQPWNAWSNLKKRMAEAHPNVWFERAIRKLADPEWRTENNAPVVFHADLVPVHRAEGGIGNPDGPHIRLEGTHWMMHNLWNDIVFELRGRLDSGSSAAVQDCSRRGIRRRAGIQV